MEIGEPALDDLGAGALTLACAPCRVEALVARDRREVIAEVQTHVSAVIRLATRMGTRVGDAGYRRRTSRARDREDRKAADQPRERRHEVSREPAHAALAIADAMTVHGSRLLVLASHRALLRPKPFSPQKTFQEFCHSHSVVPSVIVS